MHFAILVTLSFVVVCNAASLSVERDLDDYEDDSDEDPELGEYFEGDMMLTPEQMQLVENAELTRNGLRDESYRWPNKTVVYHIKKNNFDDDELKMIKRAMKDISSKTCVKFRKQKNDEHAVIIRKSKHGCASQVGYLKNKDHQHIKFSKHCFKAYGKILHEIIHTIGFHHMQSTYNRDEYVKIVWENIESAHKGNFMKYNIDTVTQFGVPYDYGSVMHYGRKTFSKNGKDTIIPLDENADIGQRKRLSERDILKINRMYYCDSKNA